MDKSPLVGGSEHGSSPNDPGTQGGDGPAKPSDSSLENAMVKTFKSFGPEMDREQGFNVTKGTMRGSR